jgi:hypothetical protein
MHVKARYAVPILAGAVLSSGLILSAAAGAVPQCVNVAPNTTHCSTGGSNQITTSPPLNQFNNGFPFFGGWGGGLVIGIG